MNRIKNHRRTARLALGVAMAGNLLAIPLASQAATYSYTDLNPTGFTGSRGYGNSGGREVGEGFGSATGKRNHALLWSGTAGSVVDLNPSRSTNRRAGGMSGNQQAG